MNRFKVEYKNGLIDIVRSRASNVCDLRLKFNEGIASITFMQPLKSGGTPSPFKPFIWEDGTSYCKEHNLA